ncbi:MAG: NAD(P)/FAD-dependent oxidoreductase [Eubacteriales bacterium]|jgi:prolycopene isomerase
MEYDCIVIGAGAAGLTAALELSCKGKKILLIEKQATPGGVATAFKRKGFTFESSLHCVNALNPEGEIRKILEECEVDKKIDFIPLEHFGRVIYPEHDFVVDFSKERYVDYLKKNFPAEEKAIERLFKRMERFWRSFDKVAYSCLPYWLQFIIRPFAIRNIIKVSGLTAGDFISRDISDEKLKGIICDIWRFIGLPPDRLSAFYFLIVFRGYYLNPTSYVKGSYAKMFSAMEERIKEAGSQVMYNNEVTKICTDSSGKVKSVITKGGEEFFARCVISNANAIDTLTRMIDNQRLTQEYKEELSLLEKSISAFQVYLGIDLPSKELGMSHHMLYVNPGYDHRKNYEKDLTDNYDNRAFGVVDHARIDPALVPEGKGSLIITVFDTYSNWTNLSAEEYEKKKRETSLKVVSNVEKYLPGLSKHIEVMEAATPKTIERYGLAPEGAMYGFAQTVEQSVERRLKQKTKVKGLFLAGGWTWPGAGVHGCVISGFEASNLALAYLK